MIKKVDEEAEFGRLNLTHDSLNEPESRVIFIHSFLYHFPLCISSVCIKLWENM